MIGFDRPLKPEWIYELLRMVQIGDDPSNYNIPFESIAKELVGKEGKRKVRTVIFRSFIYSFQLKRTKIQDNIFINWAKQYSLDYMRPLLLAKILMDYQITRFIINKMDLSLERSGNLSSKILSRKVVQEFGDRDVVKRSVRAFLNTLIHFKLLNQYGIQDYTVLDGYSLKDEQIKCFILLYSKSYLKSRVVDLSTVDTSLLYFFKDINLEAIARKYHTESWEYIRERSRNILMIKK